MANQIPLIVNAGAAQIQELATADNLEISANIVAGGILTDGYYYANGTPVTFGGGNVDLTQVTTDIIPVGNNTQSLGNATNQWQDIYVSNATIYFDSVPLTVDGSGQLTFDSNLIVQTGPNVVNTGTLETTGNIIGANVEANFFFGDGSNLTGIASGVSVSQWATGNALSNTVSNVENIWFDSTTGFNVTNITGNTALISLGSSFKTWEVAGQANLVAVGEDTVKFVAGNNIVITTNANVIPQQIEFAVSSNIVATSVSLTGDVDLSGNINFVNNTAIQQSSFDPSPGRTIETITLYANVQNDATLLYLEDTGNANLRAWQDINLNTYTQTRNNNWKFDASGDLTVPGNIIGGNANGILISSDGNVTLSSKGAEFVFDAPAGNLYLPKPNGAIVFPDDSIQTTAYTGILAAAGNAGDIQINAAGNIGADSTLRYVDNGGEMTLYADYLNAPGIFTSDIYAGDGTPSNITLTTSYGNATWTFGSDGNLSAPGNITTTSNVTANIFNLANAGNLTYSSIQQNQNPPYGSEAYGIELLTTTDDANVFSSVAAGPDYVSLKSTNAGNANVVVQGGYGVTISTSNATGGAIKNWTFTSAGNALFPGALSTALDISITGNANVQGIVSATGNIITDGFFVGNFAGNVTGNFVVLGANTQVIFNTNGNADAVGGMTFDKGPNLFTILGTVSAQGNVISGNVLTSNIVSAGGNVTGNYFIGNGSALTGIISTYSNTNVQSYLEVLTSNISTTGNIQASGNITAGNFSTTGNILGSGNFSVTGNAQASNFDTAGNILGAGNFSVTGNAVAGNFTTAGNVSASGNITGNYFIGDGSQLTNLPSGANIGNVTFSDITIQGTGDEYGYSGLYLAPGTNSTANLQYLRVRGGDYPTHIHLDTGNNQYFDQYFGADSKFVKLEANGNIVINADDYAGNGAYWTFGSDGNLTFPSGNLVINSDSTTFSNAAVISSADHNLITLSSGANGAVNSVWVEDIGNVGTSNIAALYTNPTPGSKIVRIAVGQNGGNAGPNLWDFDGTGNLTAPGNISATGNISAPYFIGDGSQLTNLPVQPGTYGNSNVATFLGDFGSNVISTSGNIAGNYILGDGSQLTNLPTGNYSNSNVATFLGDFGSNVISTSGNIAASGLLIDTVTGITSNAGNININQITGLGGYLNAFGANLLGNINAANLSLSGNIISDANISGNVNAANISAGNISLSGNIFAYGANIYSVNGLTMEGGNLTMSSITGQGGSISAEGNIIGANLSATSNVSGQNINGGNLSLSGNVISDLNIQQGNISVSGNITSGSELTVVSANITGVMGLTVSGGDIMIPSSMSGGSLSAYGNITGNYFIGNGSQLTDIVTNASNSIANGSSNVSIPTSNGEVVINPYDVTGTNKWRFSEGGTLYMPPLATIVANTSGMTLTTNDTPTAQKITLNDTIGFTPGNIVLSTDGGNYAWTLDQTGGLTAPGAISTTGNVNGGNIIGAYLYGDGSNISNISVSAGNSIINGNTNVSISGANGNITMAVGGNSAATFTTTNVFLTNVRNDTGNLTNVMYYNTSTKELTFGPASGGVYGNTQVGLYLSGGTVATDYLTSGNISATGNITGNNLNALGVVSAIGNVQGNNINTSGGVSAAGNIIATGTGTNLVRRSYTIAGSNTAVTLDNIQARVGGSPVKLYVNTVSGSLTGAGDTQTLTSGTVAISSWINVPIDTGAANAFAMSGALSSDGDTAILSLIDQSAGTGMWRITGMIANTTGNLYGVTIERLV